MQRRDDGWMEMYVTTGFVFFLLYRLRDHPMLLTTEFPERSTRRLQFSLDYRFDTDPNSRPFSTLICVGSAPPNTNCFPHLFDTPAEAVCL